MLDGTGIWSSPIVWNSHGVKSPSIPLCERGKCPDGSTASMIDAAGKGDADKGDADKGGGKGSGKP